MVVGELQASQLDPQVRRRLSARNPYIQVPSAYEAFGRLVHAFHHHSIALLRIAAVTGTNGKTTVATLLEQTLSFAGINTGYIGTTGVRYASVNRESRYTTPHSRELYSILSAMQQEGIERVCMEMSSHGIQQNRIYGLPVDVALFTNLTRDHLDYHGSMEEYAAAKRKLFSMLPRNATAVVWADDPYAEYMLEYCHAGSIVRVGTLDTFDCVVQNVDAGPHGMGFQVNLPPDNTSVNAQGPIIHVQSKLIGHFNVANLALTVVAASVIGVEADVIVRAIAGAEAPRGRLQPVVLENGVIAIVDYAHTPDALEKALSALRTLIKADGRLICVFGCGGNRDRGKRSLMGAVAAEGADVIVLTDDNPRSEDPRAIMNDIASGVPTIRPIERIHDRKQAIEWAVQKAKHGDIVLVAGKGHEEYQLTAKGLIPFSDYDVLLDLAGGNLLRAAE